MEKAVANVEYLRQKFRGWWGEALRHSPDAMAAISTLNSCRLRWRLLGAAAVVSFAVNLHFLLIGEFYDGFAYATSCVAVAIAAIVFGRAGGVTAALLSALLTCWLAGDVGWLGLAIFLTTSAIITALAELMRFGQTVAARFELAKKNQEQLTHFIEQAPAAMAMFDLKLHYLAVSGRWRDTLCLERGILGKRLYENFPALSEKWKAIHRRALAGEPLSAERDKVMRADGSAQWLRWDVRPWRRSGGDIGGIVIFFEDITERVEAEEALRQSEQQKGYLLELSDALKPLEDAEDIMEVAGESLCGHLRCHQVVYVDIDPDQEVAVIKGERAERLTPGGSAHGLVDCGQAFVADLRAGNTIVVKEIARDERADVLRQTFRLQSSGALIAVPLVKAGRLVAVMVVHHRENRDWTAAEQALVEQVAERMWASIERARSQAALHQQDRRINAIVDTAMEAIVTIDKRGVIKSANPSTPQIFGYEIEELLGRNVKMLMPDVHRERHDAYIANYLLTGQGAIIGRRRALQGLRKNGDIFPMELTVTEACAGLDVQFVGFVRDLSAADEQKRRVEALEKELMHVGRLNDMGEVASGLAHEVSQPLQAIILLAAAARRHLETTSAPPTAELVEQIQAQAKRATDILQRLRNFIEKRGASERAPEDLRHLTEDALGLAMLTSREHAAHISAQHFEADIEVNVDRVQIQQVIVNFLRNAADALANESMPEIVVATKTVKPGCVEFSVSDNGPGVDPSVASRLFRPFTTTKPHGMGVGLSLCKSIVESHGGEIGFRANDPRGAVFFFRLPTGGRATGSSSQSPQHVDDDARLRSVQRC